MTTRPEIRIENLSVHYLHHTAVHEVNLDLPALQVSSIIGPAGCGKSSLLGCINRFTDLEFGGRVEGTVFFQGRDVREAEPQALRRRLSMIFPEPNPFPRSIFENIAWAVRLHRVPGELEEIVQKCLEATNLWSELKDKLKQNATRLSAGQQQRLCIARALAVEPSVLLLDEPTTTLDPISTQKVEETIVQLKQDYTIVLVTQNMQQAARISDQTALFLPGQDRSGRLVEYGATQELFFNPKNRLTEDYLSGRFTR